jgi:myo-inositol-1(or 4)-monophosphatase
VGDAAAGDRVLSEELLDVALEAARAGAAVLVPRFGSEAVLATKSTATDPVSEADLASERAIRAVIDARRPDDGLLGEEGTGDVAGTTGLRWVVDPLDGTTDYLYGIPQWCVSVAVEDADGSLAGAVVDPLRGEEFAAVRGGGATRNGVRLDGERAASPPPLAQALVATGFGYDARVRAVQGSIIGTLLPEIRDIRRAGSAALDLVWTAAGRHDLYYEFGVKTWDIAAGRLVCTEAGLAVAELPADDVLPSGLAVGPPALLPQLLDAISARRG